MLSTPSYGNCFAFNFEKTFMKRTVLPGPSYGLSLVLNLEREEYGSITEAAGARSSWNLSWYFVTCKTIKVILKWVLSWCCLIVKGHHSFASNRPSCWRPRTDGWTKYCNRHCHWTCEYVLPCALVNLSSTIRYWKSSGFDDFQKVTIKRKPAPYGNCIFDWTEAGTSWDEWYGPMSLAYTQGVVPENLRPC